MKTEASPHDNEKRLLSSDGSRISAIKKGLLNFVNTRGDNDSDTGNMFERHIVTQVCDVYHVDRYTKRDDTMHLILGKVACQNVVLKLRCRRGIIRILRRICVMPWEVRRYRSRMTDIGRREPWRELAGGNSGWRHNVFEIENEFYTVCGTKSSLEKNSLLLSVLLLSVRENVEETIAELMNKQ